MLKQDFLARFDAFFRGEWQQLVNVSGSFPDEKQTGPAEAPPRSHSPRVPADDATRRAEGLILEPAHFRALLLRRLRLPLPFVPARCRCGREQDALGDHRSACPRSGVLRARGGPLERAAARICREAGAVVAMHTLVRDLNVGSVPGDDRRIEVIANGLPLWGGMQLAVDTTLVSALSSTSAPRRYQNRADGAALRQARRAKERTYPELLRPDSRCRLVVLALEVGGRFSPETVDFVQRLARARARSVPPRVRGAVLAAFAR